MWHGVAPKVVVIVPLHLSPAQMTRVFETKTIEVVQPGSGLFAQRTSLEHVLHHVASAPETGAKKQGATARASRRKSLPTLAPSSCKPPCHFQVLLSYMEQFSNPRYIFVEMIPSAEWSFLRTLCTRDRIEIVSWRAE